MTINRTQTESIFWWVHLDFGTERKCMSKNFDRKQEDWF